MSRGSFARPSSILLVRQLFMMCISTRCIFCRSPMRNRPRSFQASRYVLRSGNLPALCRSDQIAPSFQPAPSNSKGCLPFSPLLYNLFVHDDLMYSI
ncbi:hypothetical protein EDC04DRAFT_2825199, partial [Pisolithus marmoratus]